MTTATVKGRIIPAVRMTQGGKWVKPKAQDYLANQEWLAWELKAQLEPMPERAPIAVSATFYRLRLFQGDLDNLLKSILDALQLAGIIRNDTYVVQALARKLPAKEYKTRVAVWPVKNAKEEWVGP